jgi:hypothetical protein
MKEKVDVWSPKARPEQVQSVYYSVFRTHDKPYFETLKPQVTGRVEDSASPDLTNCRRSPKYDLNRLLASSDWLYELFILHNSSSCTTISKACDKSKRTNTVACDSSRFALISSVTFRTAVVVL